MSKDAIHHHKTTFFSEGDYPPYSQTYDAEAQSQNEDIYIYGNDNCKKGYSPLRFYGALRDEATHVTIYVGNEYIRLTNDLGFDQENCNRCLYALNGQIDPTGSENTSIFIGLNRVVNGRSDRNGFGVCAATLSWVCGWNFSENYKKTESAPSSDIIINYKMSY